jgi:hypothetical protein
MPTQFDNLPTEIKLKIFEIAANSQWSPRVVEIYFKAGQIYSKTLPPPLLHVCQISREITLKLYKPWLPRFKGMAVHKPWEKRIQKKDVEKLSRLQNVCFSLEHDVLLINDRQWSEWKFGPIERSYLRRLAVNLGGWFGWLRQRNLYMQFTALRHLNLFDCAGDQESLSFKIDHIENVFRKTQKKKKSLGSTREYVAPVISPVEIPTAVEWQGSVDEWITYKYPKLQKSPVISGRRRGRPCRGEVVGEKESLPSQPRSSSRRIIPSRQAAKRSRTEYEADIAPIGGRKTRKITRETTRKFITCDVEEQQPPRPETSSQHSAYGSLSKIRGLLEFLRSPSPDAISVRKFAASPGVDGIPIFQNPLDKYGFLREFINGSQEPLELTPEPFPAVIQHRVVSHSQ